MVYPDFQSIYTPHAVKSKELYHCCTVSVVIEPSIDAIGSIIVYSTCGVNKIVDECSNPAT